MQETRVYLSSIEGLDEDACFDRLCRFVSQERRERIAAMRRREDKLRSLAAELTLRYALGQAGVTDYTLAHGPHGKPYLASHPRLHFNLSHSHERVLCAVSACEVGCDVEYRNGDRIGVATRFFTEDEQAFLEKAATDEEKTRRFYRLWTLKESYVKALGEGMTRPMRSFSVAPDENGAITLQPPTDPSWHFHEYMGETDYAIAVCSRSPSFGEITRLRPDMLDR